MKIEKITAMARRYILALSLGLAGINAFAAPEPEVVAKEPVDNESVDKTQTSNDQTKAPDEKVLKPTGVIKNRKLGESFERFVPSETISADNAVPFPVDI